MGNLRVNQALLGRLGLHSAVAAVQAQPLDRWPHLIADRCLSDANATIATHSTAIFGAGWPVVSETLTMPRKAVGSRPATIAFLPGRVLYQALVAAVDATLAPPTRTTESWDAYEEAGLDTSHDYVAQIDIAACYEYVDHGVLRDELVLRSMDVPVSEAVIGLLNNLLHRSSGLPQMHWASDRLADTYLDVLTRQLTQDGFIATRYVDDIRIVTDSWRKANEAIERTAEYARALGLALSAEKTRVYKTATLRAQRDERDTLFARHWDAATDNETLNPANALLMRPYGGGGELETEEVSPVQDATWSLLREWHEVVGRSGIDSAELLTYQSFLGRGLTLLGTYDAWLPNELLKDLVFAHPTRLEQVCQYLLRRYGVKAFGDPYSTLLGLIANVRESPWAKVWLLSTLGQLPAAPSGDTVGDSLRAWAIDQIQDRHEIVRSEACWTAAHLGVLSTEHVTSAYKGASLLTQPALAAALAYQGATDKKLEAAIKNDNPLNGEAWTWATKQTSAA